MKTYAPDYYNEFKCIADKCKHSCCVGWEIEIDDVTLNRYKNLKGDFGKHITESIAFPDSSAPHFILNEKERCPFLQNNNLCEIIIKLGEDSLCQICTDHPRFRNFYTNCTEIGLGLCCEAAAELILNKKSATELTVISDATANDCLTDEELRFFEVREQVLSIAQNRKINFSERFKKLCSAAKLTLPCLTGAEWAKELLTLEQLDSEWTDFLEKVATTPMSGNCPVEDYQNEQLLVYFIYRHTAPDSFKDTLRFSLLCTDIILKLAPYSPEFTNLCRMFSSEIEYSEENTDFLMKF